MEWLGGRDEICVVGDDYQGICGFRGGSPSFLLGWSQRFPHAKVATLEADYRSSPEILSFANRLVPSLSGHPKQLRPTREAGPEPVLREVDDESRFVVETVCRLNVEGLVFEEMTVLVRVNRSRGQFRLAGGQRRYRAVATAVADSVAKRPASTTALKTNPAASRTLTASKAS